MLRSSRGSSAATVMVSWSTRTASRPTERRAALFPCGPRRSPPWRPPGTTREQGCSPLRRPRSSPGRPRHHDSRGTRSARRSQHRRRSRWSRCTAGCQSAQDSRPIRGWTRGSPEDKDASDVVSMMQTSSPREAGATLAQLRTHPVAGEATTDALEYLNELFGRRAGEGVPLAQRALLLAVPDEQIATLCVTYTERLLQSARGD